jgi:hypothetical protein
MKPKIYKLVVMANTYLVWCTNITEFEVKAIN